MERHGSSPPVSAPSPRRWPVRAYLVLLASALTLPGLGFTGVLMARIAASERAGLAAEARSAATRTAEALDRELIGRVATLQALATSPALAEGDLPAFAAQARNVVAATGASLVLSNALGRTLVQAGPSGGGDQEASRRAVEQRRPVVSDLVAGADGRSPMLSVSLPVPRAGGAPYVLSLGLAPDSLSAILISQRLPDGWSLTVMDGDGTIIARSIEPERFVGRPANADLLARATGDGGRWVGPAADGRPVFIAYTRVPAAEWRVAVGVPVETLEAPLRQVLMVLGAAAAATIALSGGIAWLLASHLAGPLRDLAGAGRRLGRGEPPGRVWSRVTEVDEVAQALTGAATALTTRTEALAAERARLAAVFEAAPVGIVIAEAPSGRLVAGNAQAEHILGRPARPGGALAAFAGTSARHADGRAVTGSDDPLRRALGGEERPALEFCFARDGDAPVWLQAVAAPIRDADGGITGAVVAVLDVDEVVRARERSARFAEELESVVAERTGELEQALAQLRDEMDRRSLAEEQLRQAQKMESVGRLTGGIAHDFNNLLTIVIGSLELLRRRVDDPRAVRLLASATEGANRAATLTARLLAFSRRQPLAPRPLDVNALVAGMADLLRRTLGETVRLRTQLDPALNEVRADQNQLESALLNLAVNARDAMDGAPGTLTIRTWNTTLDPASAERAEVPPGDYVALAVGDTGPGMPPDVVQRAFEPFFTTKALGRGTGLGLSQVHGFVKQSGGHVAIDARTEPGPDRGTTVRILLPRRMGDDDPAGEDEAHAGELPQARPGEAVLVVEDEAGVRRFSAEALRELGYEVVEASDAEAALARLGERPGLSLLFTDVVLPGADGHSLAAEARRRRPGLRVLFTSGHDRGGYVPESSPEKSNEPEADMLAKPFTLAALARRVREVLDRPGAEAPAKGRRG